MKTLMGFGNAVLLALNLSALGTVAFKGRIWQPDPSPPSPLTAEPLSEMLDLSLRQMSVIETNREASAVDWEQKLDQLQSARDQLLAALRNDSADPDRLAPLVEAIGDMQTQLEKQAVTQLLQERDLLTPQQQERYLFHLESRLRQGCGCGRGFQGGRMWDVGTAPGELPGRGRRGGRRGGGPRWQ